jgi:dTDP-4-dehydrorhamnose reductase
MILLLGGRGYVGSAYRAFFEKRGIPYRSFVRSEQDYTRETVLKELVKEYKPDFLVNCAGYTGKPNVDACETDKANCLFGNAVFPGIISRVCQEAGVPWGHVSSGCIYTGKRPDGSGFREDDTPNFSFRTNNCSFYSGTKALGEEVLKDDPSVYIWRLRIPFNHENGPRNYLSKLLNYQTLLDAENSISHLNEFVATTFSTWEKKVAPGIYNVTNPGYMTTREVTELLMEYGLRKTPFQFFETEDEFMRIAAKTPRSNCVMNTDKLEGTGLAMTPVIESVRQCLEQWTG